MPSGPYKGQKLNVEAKRAIAILNGSELEKQLATDPKNWLIANVYHNKKFYLASIPKAAVENVMLLSEPMFGVLMHSMLRFQFSEPVRLLAEMPTVGDLAQGRMYHRLDEPIQLRDLMLSVEATSPHGIPEFSAVESFFNTRGLVFRWMSLTGLGVSRLLSGQATILQFPLNLTAREKARALRNALIKSDETGMAGMYNTIKANCNQYCFRILERTSPLSLRQREGLRKFIATSYIFAANFVSFTSINPVLSRLGLTWSMWRRPEIKEVPRLERDPEFLHLSESYPRSEKCGELLVSLNLP